MNTNLIAAFERKQSAEDLTAWLQQRNIPAVLVDLTTSLPENALPVDYAKYQVLVAESDAPAAVDATCHNPEGVELLRPAVRCPDCGSTRVRYPEMPRNFVLPFLFRFFVRKKIVSGSYLCLSCRNEWRPRAQKSAA